jgi:hypothetical protein
MDRSAFSDMRDVLSLDLRTFVAWGYMFRIQIDIFWSLKFDTNFPTVTGACSLRMKTGWRESEVDRSDGKLNYVLCYVCLTACSLLIQTWISTFVNWHIPSNWGSINTILWVKVQTKRWIQGLREDLVNEKIKPIGSTGNFSDLY